MYSATLPELQDLPCNIINCNLTRAARSDPLRFLQASLELCTSERDFRRIAGNKTQRVRSHYPGGQNGRRPLRSSQAEEPMGRPVRSHIRSTIKSIGSHLHTSMDDNMCDLSTVAESKDGERNRVPPWSPETCAPPKGNVRRVCGEQNAKDTITLSRGTKWSQTFVLFVGRRTNGKAGEITHTINHQGVLAHTSTPRWGLRILSIKDSILSPQMGSTRREKSRNSYSKKERNLPQANKITPTLMMGRLAVGNSIKVHDRTSPCIVCVLGRGQQLLLEKL
ncbi:hypothetical protein M5K25_016926 [Dendrobium thyrsiflorum]|uniref:Uncharacterized protein n=1 Tax=Dendrobium thyrsiflorum TaxID=117978 RepID=A0ABD0ULI2_DENTH